jgi:hypothetical protein
MNQVKKIVSDYPVTSGIIGLGILIFGGRAIRKALKPGPYIPPVPPIPTPSPTPNQGSKYTYGAQQYADFADIIFDACDGMAPDEEPIGRVMSAMRTYDDVLALIDAYGRREVPVFRSFGWTATAPMTLALTLKSELSPADLEKYVNVPLKRTGYKFTV